MVQQNNSRDQKHVLQTRDNIAHAWQRTTIAWHVSSVAQRFVCAILWQGKKEKTKWAHTLAGGTRPAAVICPVKNLGKWFAASTTAR